MRNNKALLGLFVLFTLVFVPLSAARAELSISVVDVERILTDSKAAKAVQKQVEEKRKGFIGDVENAEKKLRDKQKALQAEAAKLSKEDLTKKAKEFEESRVKERNQIQEEKSRLDKAYSEAMNTLTKSIYDVCQAIADEKKIDLVITRQNIIVGSKSLDITDEVLKRLDEKLPTLSLKVK